MDEEFTLLVLPSNQFTQFPINESSEFLIEFHADITLLTPLDDCDTDEDAPDFESTTQERFLYDKDLNLNRKDLQNDSKVCRAPMVNALTEIKALNEKYYDEIVDEVLKFVNDDVERFNQCDAVSVVIEIVKYAEFDDEVECGTNASFTEVLADEKLSESEQCVICLSGFGVGVKLLKLKCHHVFHRKCLYSWLDRSVSCPLCRLEPPNYVVRAT